MAPKLKEIGVDWSDEEEEEEDMGETVAAAAPLEPDTTSDALTRDSADVGDADQISKNEGSLYLPFCFYIAKTVKCVGIVLAIVFLSQG